MNQLLVKKNNNDSNVSSNISATPVPSYYQEEARSMDNNHQNIEGLFIEPINIVTAQNVSTNTTSSSEGIDSYFELVVKTLKDHIANLEKQLRDKQYIIGELLRKSDQNYCGYTTDTIIPSSEDNQCNINKGIDTDNQWDHIINSTQLTFTCSKSTTETLEKDVKYVQSYQ